MLPARIRDLPLDELLAECLPLTREMIDGLDELLDGVEYDRDGELPDDPEPMRGDGSSPL